MNADRTPARGGARVSPGDYVRGAGGTLWMVVPERDDKPSLLTVSQAANEIEHHGATRIDALDALLAERTAAGQRAGETTETARTSALVRRLSAMICDEATYGCDADRLGAALLAEVRSAWLATVTHPRQIESATG